MNVLVNGEERELRDGARLVDAVVASGAPEDHRGVAAAVNGEVVPRGQWDLLKLSDGARVEVLQAVQGG